MADYFWTNAAADNDGNNATNWNTAADGSGSSGVMPGSADRMVFTNNFTANCTFSAAINVLGILLGGTTTGNYTGIVDLGNSSFAHTIGTSGIVDEVGCTATFDWGNAAISMSGPIDLQAATTTYSSGCTTTFTSGTGLTCRVKNGQNIPGITVNASVSIDVPVNNFVQNIRGPLVVNGTATLNANTYWTAYGSVTVNTGGTITGDTSSFVEFQSTFPTMDGTWSNVKVRCISNITIPAATYSNAELRIHCIGATRTVTLSTGTTTVGSVGCGIFDGSSFAAINASTNAATLTVTGDIFRAQYAGAGGFRWNASGQSSNLNLGGDLSETVDSWTAGTGTITLDGGNDQSIDFNGASVEAIVVDKSASGDLVTFTGGFDAADFDVTEGSVDLGDVGNTYNSDSGWYIRGSGTFDFGSGNTINSAGAFDAYGVSVAGDSTSKIYITSNGDVRLPFNSNCPVELVINAGVTTSTIGNAGSTVNGLTVHGTFNQNNSQGFRVANLTVKSTGTLAGTGSSMTTSFGDDGSVVVESGGTVTFSGYCGARVLTSVAGDLGAMSLSWNPWNNANHDCTVTGNVTCQNLQWYTPSTANGAEFTLAGYDLTIKQDADFNAAGAVYTKSAGTIRLEGTAAQDLDLTTPTEVDDIVINKTSGTVTLIANGAAESLTLTSGTLDTNGYNLTISGNYTQNAGTAVQDSGVSDGTITVAGTFAINGTVGSGCTWDGTDLVVNGGSATADYLTVGNSTATGTASPVITTNSTESPADSTDGWGFDAGGSTENRTPTTLTNTYTASNVTPQATFNTTPTTLTNTYTTTNVIPQTVVSTTPATLTNTYTATNVAPIITINVATLTNTYTATNVEPTTGVVRTPTTLTNTYTATNATPQTVVNTTPATLTNTYTVTNVEPTAGVVRTPTTLINTYTATNATPQAIVNTTPATLTNTYTTSDAETSGTVNRTPATLTNTYTTTNATPQVVVNITPATLTNTYTATNVSPVVSVTPGTLTNTYTATDVTPSGGTVTQPSTLTNTYTANNVTPQLNISVTPVALETTYTVTDCAPQATVNVTPSTLTNTYTTNQATADESVSRSITIKTVTWSVSNVTPSISFNVTPATLTVGWTVSSRHPAIPATTTPTVLTNSWTVSGVGAFTPGVPIKILDVRHRQRIFDVKDRY